MRTKLFYIVLSIVFLTKGNAVLYGQKETNTAPTSNVKNATVISTDTILKKKKYLESKVEYFGKSYAKFDQKKQIITLMDEAVLKYQDYELKAGIIVFDYKKNEVYAGRLKDTAGNFIQYPVFKQGGNVIEPDSIRFNFKTKKALVWNSRTKQQEMYIKAEKTKKENDSTYYMKGARVTTSANLEDPEYYFLVRKMKFVPGKKVVAGFTNMYIYNVPTPIAVPFAFFPITTKARSGIIIPAYGQSNSRGFFLQNGGYYFALSDHYDLALLGDYYTNGSYALRAETNYGSRYHFTGAFSLRFENQITGERGFPGYAKQNIYNIQWNHSKDPKSNPNSRFSASVNLGSSKYFQQSLNLANLGSQLNNTLSSSVTFSKTFKTVPQINFTTSANHTQNNQSQMISLTLPTLQASMDRVYPFAPKSGIKKGFIQNINFQYNVNGRNQYNVKEDIFFKSEMFKNGQMGMQHTLPLSTNFKVFQYFSFTSSLNYNEVWVNKTIRKDYDAAASAVVSTTVNGFDAFRTYSISNSVGTSIYGTFKFKGKGRLQSIRHTMRPTLTHNYTPGFNQYFQNYTSDAAGTVLRYTRFESGIYGAPTSALANALDFSLVNVLEAKVKDKDSTKTELKKIFLLNNLTFGTRYNFAADGFKLDAFRMTGGTALFKQKMNVNFAAVFDPYVLNDEKVRVDKYVWNDGGFLRMTSANITINYSFNSAGDGSQKENTQGLRNGGRNDDLFGSNKEPNRTDENEEEKDTFAGFYNAIIPWDINLAYALTYSNALGENKITGNSLMISANTTLTSKWTLGASTGYDFQNKGVTFTQLRINRDLDSWSMNFNWSPFGLNPYWGFFIGIKSGMLSDIKWDKNSQPDRTLR
ncbi:putative LPS assembly protein LptD [Flavobacterium sp. N1719]|uniref:putative LPS assembly protein LptD n=1 Tax=Flavobacterium sp. N1719 TaxID=2885633 RepID=UPI0022237F3D|nr:putative LPS assembly protein LptD [Flavobacterium sp. N1719]